MSMAPGRASTLPVVTIAEWVHWAGTTRPHSANGMRTPIQHEQAYTPTAGTFPDSNTTAGYNPVVVHHERAPLLVMHRPKQSALSQEKSTFHFQHPNDESSRQGPAQR